MTTTIDSTGTTRLCMLALAGIFALNAMAARGVGQGTDSVLSLLPGVDDERLDAAAEIWLDPPPRDAVEAAAKLLWALSRIEPQVLAGLASAQAEESDQAVRVARVRGRVARYDAIRIPPELAEVLEFERLYRVVVQRDSSAAANMIPASVGVVTGRLPSAWLGAGGDVAAGVGQTVEFTAVRVGSGLETRLYASRLGWYPDGGEAGDSLPLGWRMLAAEGVDVGRLAEVAARNRQPLMAEDSEAFYGMLAAAAAIGGSAEQPAANRIEVMQMLRDPAALVGRWIRLDVSTARFSRVMVTTPERRAELGRDAYWQIDAFAELSGAKVQLESPEEGGEPLVFENRFPVSLAILDLPAWLAAELRKAEGVSEGQVGVSMLAEPLVVDGFFFRLWSYDSEFAESRGGRQIGPLILAAELHRRPPNEELQRGVAAIGWIWAAVLIASMGTAAVVLWRVGRRDRAVARARRETPPQLPSSPT